MKTFLILVFSIVACPFLSPLTFAEIRPDETLSFDYVTNDGSIYLDCTYKPLPTEPEFYRVTCGQSPGVVKVFDVRFRVRPLGWPNKPAYEIVMWTTDRNYSKPVDYGTTVWVHFTRGSITQVTIHQDVDNVYAALVARYSITVGKE